MGDTSAIEWTDATWNPVTGCTKVSPGCDHCYAEGIANRFRGPAFPNGFEVTLRENRLEEPLRWKQPRRVFVNSMSDLFHEAVPDDYIARVFLVMAQTPQHTYQVLTKRHGRMRSLLSNPEFRRRVYGRDGALGPWPLDNVWLGVSVEDQKWADVRVPALLATPAAVRFLSCEPLLGPVELEWSWLWCDHDSYSGTGDPRVWKCDSCPYTYREIEDPNGTYWVSNLLTNRTFKARKETVYPEAFIDWVIVGGESGAGARPMQPHWAYTLRDQCEETETAFFFKQWGSHDEHGKRMSKHAAGRLLGGRTWDEYPLTGGSAVAHA